MLLITELVRFKCTTDKWPGRLRWVCENGVSCWILLWKVHQWITLIFTCENALTSTTEYRVSIVQQHHLTTRDTGHDILVKSDGQSNTGEHQRQKNNPETTTAGHGRRRGTESRKERWRSRSPVWVMTVVCQDDVLRTFNARTSSVTFFHFVCTSFHKRYSARWLLQVTIHFLAFRNYSAFLMFLNKIIINF